MAGVQVAGGGGGVKRGPQVSRIRRRPVKQDVSGWVKLQQKVQVADIHADQQHVVLHRREGSSKPRLMASSAQATPQLNTICWRDAIKARIPGGTLPALRCR